MEYTECSHTRCGNPVFSRGICRKHYEKERLETAALCSFSSCKNKAYRGDLCSAHYQKKQKASKPICTVAGCTDHQKTLKSRLCEKHLFRYSRHGTVEQPRNADWGSRESHPLYQSYRWHCRNEKSICPEWKEDFWLFVSSVGPKQEGYTLRRHNSDKPLGPSNWYWKESTSSKNKAVYAKEWRKKNPDKAKNADLKRYYGITLEQYKLMSTNQYHCCAICGEKETSVDAKGAETFMPVDHCHKTGKIRALLCSACNKSLGGFKDDPVLLRKAAEYIEKHATPDALLHA
jgi:hypothetical protein